MTELNTTVLYTTVYYLPHRETKLWKGDPDFCGKRIDLAESSLLSNTWGGRWVESWPVLSAEGDLLNFPITIRAGNLNDRYD